MTKTTRHATPADQTGKSDPESIPSTLDPNLDPDATDLERELAEHEREEHDPVEQDNPEEEIYGDVQRAAESLPADVPVDRADQTDKRMENPPARVDIERDAG
ncbi:MULTISPECIES: hypothetical protein [unclassified Cupriavidus]|uniref:hypothetical protein n=1 Tax=Cupriavidus sp. H19C3 TaxID=3241603 RepID=UPI0011D9FA6B|nr:MAG: hypothetical protein E6Q40_16035 [Cupriavidus sp.]